VEAAYASAGVSWFTPVELFKPWYARALARRVLASHAASSAAAASAAASASPPPPLRVYELGGGGGTAARGVLDAVAELAPDVYATMTYVSVEASCPQRSETHTHTHTCPFSRSDPSHALTPPAAAGERAAGAPPAGCRC
jgi:hypothetical protein